MSRAIDYVELLEAAQRERAEQRLLWLRDPTRPQQPDTAYTRLFGREGWESLELAILQRRYNDAELAQLPEAVAELARERARLRGRGWLGTFLHQPLAVGSTERVPAAVLAPLIEPIQTRQSPGGPSEALRALGAALEPHVRRMLELRDQAEHDAATLLEKLTKLLPKPNAAPAEATLARLSAAERETLAHLPEAVQSQLLTSAEPSEVLAQLPEAARSRLPTGAAHAGERAALAQLPEAVRSRLSSGAELSAAERAALAQLPEAVRSRLPTGAAHAGERAAFAQLPEAVQSPLLVGTALSAAEREVLARLVAPANAVPTTAELATAWLDRTDDAWHELSRWLIKHSELPSTENDLARILVGLRALKLDGLARPDRRFFRLAQGARRLGFERDMTARMRGENAPGLLVPQPVCIALSAPRDVRVLQPDPEYGVLSDLSVAQGMGEGLALALISPAVSPLLTHPRGASVSAAMGGLFAELRADSEYLRRVDGFERDAAEQAARVAALWLLARARLHAALTLVWTRAARSSEERVQQLSAAGERALGRAVPRGMLALTLLAEDTSEEQWLGLHWGLELHTLLRERFDQDFYLNPRLSDVLRGAAARGAGLDAPGLATELGMRRSAALDRLFELLS